MYDYRSFRLSKLNRPEFEHVKLLLFWPFFGLAFLVLERLLKLDFHPISCAFDNIIPFNEYFIIPYYFWFVFIIGMLVYSFLFDIPTFRRYMKYIIITYTVTLLIYVIYPTRQDLRPPVFERNNIFTRIVGFLYAFDTNTNVCPSLHVIGSMAVYFAARKSKLFGKFLWRIVFLFMTTMICISTVFLKQHSIIDIAAGVLVSLSAYPLVYNKKGMEEKQPSDKSEKLNQYA